jgi:hypothetical protein
MTLNNITTRCLCGTLLIDFTLTVDFLAVHERVEEEPRFTAHTVTNMLKIDGRKTQKITERSMRGSQVL